MLPVQDCLFRLGFCGHPAPAGRSVHNVLPGVCVLVCQGEDYLWVPICKGCSPYWRQRWENIVPVRILERVRFRRACASRRLYHVHIVLCDLY